MIKVKGVGEDGDGGGGEQTPTKNAGRAPSLLQGPVPSVVSGENLFSMSDVSWRNQPDDFLLCERFSKPVGYVVSLCYARWERLPV